MPYKIIANEERINDLINRAFGLEMVRELLDYKLNESEARKEIEEINREINRINRKVRKLMQVLN